MGRPEIRVPQRRFVYGGEAETLCRECQLPCRLDETSVDCFRRFFLQGLLQCTYFVHGYCFLVDKAGCVFDNDQQTVLPVVVGLPSSMTPVTAQCGGVGVISEQYWPS